MRRKVSRETFPLEGSRKLTLDEIGQLRPLRRHGRIRLVQAHGSTLTRGDLGRALAGKRRLTAGDLRALLMAEAGIWLGEKEDGE